MCLQTKNIIKNRDVVFMEGSMSIGKTLKMRPSGSNESLRAVVVDESSKSSSSDDGDEWDEQVGDHLVLNEKAIRISMENDDSNKIFTMNGQYSKKNGVHLERGGRIKFNPTR
jgi:hypothetical protein